MNQQPEIGAIYSYTNAFGYTETIKITLHEDTIIWYHRLLDTSEWSREEYTMTVGKFVIYTKIS